MPYRYRQTHIPVPWVDLHNYCKIQYFAINTKQFYSKIIKHVVTSVSSCDNKVKQKVLTAGTSNDDLHRRVTKELVKATLKIFNKMWCMIHAATLILEFSTQHEL